MIRSLQKTCHRCCSFVLGALAWRAPERQYAVVVWCLIAGVAWLLISVAFDPRPFVLLLAGLYLVGVLTAICAIDARYGIIPNSLVVGLAFGALFKLSFSGRSELAERAIDATLVFVIACALRVTYRWIRGYDGFGFGDVKFVTAGVLWIDIASMPTLLLIAVFSAFTSLLVMKAEGCTLDGKQAVPFGPHLATGLWLTWILPALQLQ
jgi:leader peptidase (prepilin peptidase)/N-methyltransferase